MNPASACRFGYRHLLHLLRELRVDLEQFSQFVGLTGRDLLPLHVRAGQFLAVLRIRIGMHPVAVGLASLSQQDEKRGVPK